MEEYEDIENNAPDAFDAFDAPATTTTPGGDQHETLSQTGQIMHEGGVESEGNQLGNVGALRATSGNATKRLKSRVTTRAGKSAEAAIKKFATQELQVEKDKMQGWKKNVMQEVGRELQVIKQRQEEAMKAQRQSFQMELERVRGKQELWESKSKMLEDEIRLLKTPGQHTAQKKPAAKRAQMTSDNEHVDKQGDEQGDKRKPP